MKGETLSSFFTLPFNPSLLSVFNCRTYVYPVIGFEGEFGALTPQNLLDFHKAWYQPNNAVLIVSGDATPEDVLTLAEKHFGIFEPGDVPARIRPDAVRPFEPGFEEVTDASVRSYLIKFLCIYAA